MKWILPFHPLHIEFLSLPYFLIPPLLHYRLEHPATAHIALKPWISFDSILCNCLGTLIIPFPSNIYSATTWYKSVRFNCIPCRPNFYFYSFLTFDPKLAGLHSPVIVIIFTWIKLVLLGSSVLVACTFRYTSKIRGHCPILYSRINGKTLSQNIIYTSIRSYSLFVKLMWFRHKNYPRGTEFFAPRGWSAAVQIPRRLVVLRKWHRLWLRSKLIYLEQCALCHGGGAVEHGMALTRSIWYMAQGIMGSIHRWSIPSITALMLAGAVYHALRERAM